MNSLLQLLDILTALLGRWLNQERAREVQESYEHNHTDPQGRFADRFGPAAGVSSQSGDQLPTTQTTTDMEPRR